MGSIHPAVSEICTPQSLDPICGKFDKFLPHGQMTVHNYRPRQFHRTSNGENPSSGYRDMGSASLAAARPAARTVTTIPLQPGGLRGKQHGFQRMKHHYMQLNPMPFYSP